MSSFPTTQSHLILNLKSTSPLKLTAPNTAETDCSSFTPMYSPKESKLSKIDEKEDETRYSESAKTKGYSNLASSKGNDLNFSLLLKVIDENSQTLGNQTPTETDNYYWTREESVAVSPKASSLSMSSQGGRRRISRSRSVRPHSLSLGRNAALDLCNSTSTISETNSSADLIAAFYSGPPSITSTTSSVAVTDVESSSAESPTAPSLSAPTIAASPASVSAVSPAAPARPASPPPPGPTERRSSADSPGRSGRRTPPVVPPLNLGRLSSLHTEPPAATLKLLKSQPVGAPKQHAGAAGSKAQTLGTAHAGAADAQTNLLTAKQISPNAADCRCVIS